jgi:hypothetical protein
MCVVGAAWDKERARDLGGTYFYKILDCGTHSYTVGTDTFTTFYVAALSEKPAGCVELRCFNKCHLRAVQRQGRPRFQCLFTVSYGLGREELEQLNFEIKYKEYARGSHE